MEATIDEVGEEDGEELLKEWRNRFTLVTCKDCGEEFEPEDDVNKHFKKEHEILEDESIQDIGLIQKEYDYGRAKHNFSDL